MNSPLRTNEGIDNSRNGCLVFVANAEQLQALSSQDWSREHDCIASLDIDLTLKLRKDGKEVIDLSAYATASAIFESRHRAWHICQLVRECLRGRVLLDGCDLIDRTANELLYPLSAIFLQDILIGACLADRNPTHVVHGAEMQQSIEWNLRNKQYPDIFNALVAISAEARSISTTAVVSPAPPPAPSSIASFPESALAPRKNHRKPTGAFHTICFSPKPAAGEMRLLLKEVAAQNTSDWLLVTDHDPNIKLNVLREELLLDLPFSTSKPEADIEQLRAQGPPAAMLSRCAPDIAQLLGHPSLRFVWNHYYDNLLRWSRLHAAARLLCLSTNPRILVVGYDIFASCRVVQGAFSASGVPSLAIDHVGCGLDSSHQRNLGAQGHAAVWGPVDGEAQRKWRGAQWTVVNVGSLRTDHSAWESILNSQTRESPQLEGSSGALTRTVVFLTSNGTSLAEYNISLDLLLRSWEELLSCVRQHPEWKFIIKPHPSCDYPALYEQDQFLLENLQIFSGKQGKGGAIDLLRSGCTAAVLVNCPSTVVVDAVAAGVPVLYLKSAVWEESGSPIENTVCKVVHSVSELDHELKRISEDSGYRAELVDQQLSALPNLLCAVGPSAVNRARRAIEELQLPTPPTHGNKLGRMLVELAVFGPTMSRSELLRWISSLRSLAHSGDAIGSDSSELGFTDPTALRQWLWRILLASCKRSHQPAKRLARGVVLYLAMPPVFRLPLSAFRRDLKQLVQTRTQP